MSKKEAIFIPLSETRGLIAFLQGIKEGEVVEWDVLCRAAGVDVRGDRRNILNSARDRILKDRGISTSIVPEGLRCDTAPERVQKGHAYLQRVSNMSRRGMRLLGTVDYDKLGEDLKPLHTVSMATLGALAHASSTRSQKRLQEKIGNNGSGPLLVGDTLRLFAGVTE